MGFFWKTDFETLQSEIQLGQKGQDLFLIDSSPPATTLNVNAHVWESDSYLTFISESSMVGLY
jgi:hypothetical protein